MVPVLETLEDDKTIQNRYMLFGKQRCGVTIPVRTVDQSGVFSSQ